MVPSLSSGVVGSRFITQDEIEDAKARKEEQWKAAYARYFRPGIIMLCSSISMADSDRNPRHDNKRISVMVVVLQK